MFGSMLQDMADEFIGAVAQDLSDPAIQAQLRREIDSMASRILGVDVRHNPIAARIWNEVVKNAKGEMDGVIQFAGLAISSPPDSVDTAASVLKDGINEKIGGLADVLKKKLEEKNTKEALCQS